MEEAISLDIFNESNKWMLAGLVFSKEAESDEITLTQTDQESPFLSIRLKVISIIRTLYIFFLQDSKKTQTKRIADFKDLIVETEREYRHINYFRYVNQEKNPVYKIIKVYDPKNFSKIQELNLKKFFIILLNITNLSTKLFN